MINLLSRLHKAQQKAITEGVDSFTIDFVGTPEDDKRYIVTISGHFEDYDGYTMTTTFHLEESHRLTNDKKMKRINDFVETVKRSPKESDKRMVSNLKK